MELFVVISGVGTLLLLAVPMREYWVESGRQTARHGRLPATKETVLADAPSPPMEAETRYDEAA